MTGQIHGHTWEVIAWFSSENAPDAIILQTKLKMLLAAWDHTVLKPELARAEDMAAAIHHLLGCVSVDVFRPSEKLYARVT